MKKLKVMTVFGTRPEAIKMAPLVLELRKYPQIESYVTVTAQHRQMLDQVLEAFDLKPDFDLNIMKERQTLAEITSNALMKLDELFQSIKPTLCLFTAIRQRHLRVVLLLIITRFPSAM